MVEHYLDTVETLVRFQYRLPSKYSTMKLRKVLTENPHIKPPKWLEGYNAFWDGVDLNACPYDDEQDKVQWTNGWQYASGEE